MSKLPEDKKFIDFSDYARPFAIRLVKILLPTKIGAYSITVSFLFVGLVSAYLIHIQKYPLLAAFLILLKSMLDAADGEIARQRNEPSMVGRYLDSVFDFIVNLVLFYAIYSIFHFSIWEMILALALFQLQGSIFNYYYLVKRYQADGDRTSRIFERELPAPFERDNLIVLKFLHKLYLLIYGWQDYIIYKLDSTAINGRELPSWFLTLVSFFGLGFQLLIVAVLLITNHHDITFFFFTYVYSLFGIIVILIRKILVT